jgi:UDP-N-acetyl-D-glucosamine/UDP-N-acetyl-D-galactosamine dehydrogenase
MNFKKEQRVKNIAIIGIGYIGLPLAIEFHKHYKVTCYDFSTKRINELNKNIDSNNESNLTKLNPKNINFTNNKTDLKNNDVYILCVPTPVLINKKPDLGLIVNATKLVAKSISKNSIIVYESTVYPGVTEDVCLPIIKQISKLKYNKDFSIAYSPERINPGDRIHNLKNIIKVVSASNKNALRIIDTMYKKICLAGTFKAESIKVAEGSKVIENIQRDLNIALMNELSIIFDKMNVNFQQVLEAANTKWNFLDFKPGLVGGHCIGIDPYYLTYKAKTLNYSPKIILSGRKINDNMHKEVLSRILKKCKKLNIKVPNSNVLLLGATFKENCSDFRNSKSVELYNLLKNKFNDVDFYDPLVDYNDFMKKNNIKLKKKIGKKKYNLILIAVSHNFFSDMNFYNNNLKKNSFIFSIKKNKVNSLNEMNL